MRKILFIALVTTFQIQQGVAQTAKTDLRDLVETLNARVAPTISLQLDGDTISFGILEEKMMHYRPKKPTGSKLLNARGIKRSKGTPSWHYQFNSITATSSRFRPIPENSLQLILTFTDKKNHLISAKKGWQGCVVKGPDYVPHKVIWSNQRAMTLIFDRDKLKENHLQVHEALLNGSLKEWMGNGYPVSLKRYWEKNCVVCSMTFSIQNLWPNPLRIFLNSDDNIVLDFQSLPT